MSGRTESTALWRIVSGSARCLWDPMAVAELSRRFAIERRASDAVGLLVDVGAGRQPYRELLGSQVTRYVALDLPSRQAIENEVDVGGDAMALPLRGASVDSLLCVSVLMYVPAPDRAIAEFSRVLRSGGKLILVGQQIRGESAEKNDRWRFSRQGLAELAASSGLSVVEIEPCNGIFGTIGHMWSHWLYETLAVRGPVPSPLARMLCAIGLVPCWILDQTGWGGRQTMYWMLVAQKP